jgi:hypothetical protein
MDAMSGDGPTLTNLVFLMWLAVLFGAAVWSVYDLVRALLAWTRRVSAAMTAVLHGSDR